ncbi:hypothetical protein [Sulfurovum sp.]|uniref:hypothetical protein n=1 Tax=Sulfurovum sp. TaxID=1969726 RepID=UPI002867E592|nr:hypothetical protein [Sulfurovum sp.]
MSVSHDEKAMLVLEKAVERAKNQLEKTNFFQPFLMLLNSAGAIEIFENARKDSKESYTLLEDTLKTRLEEGHIDVMVLAVDTLIPEKFVKDVPSAIRLHLEEKSQIEKKISARFLYVPYELCSVGDCELFVRLHTPVAIGFPAEYIVR